MSWFGKKKGKDEKKIVSSSLEENISDEPVVLTAYGFEDKVELTATTIRIISFEKKFVVVEDMTSFEAEAEWQLDLDNSKVLAVNVIPRDKISRVIIKQSLPAYIMYVDSIKTIRFGSSHIEEFEKIFAEIDNTNYKIYMQPKEEIITNICDIKMCLVEEYDTPEEAAKEANCRAMAGWMPQGASATDGHVNVGRTAFNVALMGPLGLIGGASRTNGKITVTYVRTPRWLEEHNMGTKKPEVPTSSGSNDVITQLERLAKLRDQGILTEEEFQQQKTKIMNS